MLLDAKKILHDGRAFTGSLFDSLGAGRAIDALPDLPPLAFVGAYECRLEENCDQVDFELCLRRSDELVESLGRINFSTQDHVWAGALELVERWAERRDDWLDPIIRIWLEIDVADRPRPFVVFTLDEEFFHPDAKLSADRVATFAGRMFDATGARLQTGTGNTLIRLLHELPPAAQVRHLASRPTEALDLARLIIQMPWQTLPPLLSRLDWSGDRTGLETTLEELCVDTPVNSINIDLGSQLGERIGVEFSFQGSAQTDPRWRRLLDRLVGLGACSPGKRDALKAWTSSAEERKHGPADRLIRDLLIKVVAERGRPLRAKAYLPFAPAMIL